MGLSHLAVLNAHSSTNVVAICDGSKILGAGFKKYTHYKFFNDFDEMLERENLDALVIATPSKFHEAMIRKAFEKGLHIFSEKPLTLNHQNSADLSRIAEQKGLVNQVGYHNRFIGTFRKAKELLESGAIGTPYHVNGEAYGPVVVGRKSGTWRSKAEEGGGCLYDYTSHVINLLEYFVGSATSVSGSVLKKVFSKDVDDATFATLKFAGDITGQISVNWSEDSYRKMSTQIIINGDKGKIIVDAHELKIHMREENTRLMLQRGWNILNITTLALPVEYYLRGEEYSAQIAYFIDQIESGDRPENVSSFATAASTDRTISLIIKDSM
jgi:predicted dehydrogenase